MCEKEIYYIEKYGGEYVLLKEACQIWCKPGYSKLSKELPKVGYEYAIETGQIPCGRWEAGSFIMRICDILEFIDKKDDLLWKRA